MSSLRIPSKVIVGFLLLLSLVTIPAISQGSSVRQSYVTTYVITNTIQNQQFDVPGYTSSGCYYSDIQLEEGYVGTELFGTVQASQPINFWVLSSSQLQRLQAVELTSKGGGVCGKVVPPSAHVAANGITSYSMDWTVPDSDNYYFVFWNPRITDTNISFTCWSQVFRTFTSATYQPTSYTSSLASLPNASSQLLPSNSFTFNNYVVFFVFLVVVSGVVIFVIWKRHRGTK